MRKLILSLLICFAVVLMNAQQADLPIKWRSLVLKANLEFQSLPGSIENIPSTIFEGQKPDSNDSESIQSWILNYPVEVSSFLAIQEIAQLNPARAHLGLRLVEQAYFEHSFLQWLEAAELTEQRMSLLAPHCPQPRKTGDPDFDLEIFDAALQDWMHIFPQEYQTLINEPGMKVINAFESGQYEIGMCHGCQRFTQMSVTSKEPVFGDYDSGNPRLDMERFELATKHWYFRYQPGQFVKKYEIRDHLIDMEMSPGANFRFAEPELTPQ